MPLINRSVFGSKAYDLRYDGLAHYGMLAELIEALDTFQGGPTVVDHLYSSAEATIRMWEACEAAKANVP